MIAALVITFIAGFGCGAFFYHVFTNPVLRMRRKAKHDLKHRLGTDGLPLNPLNDYERHLFALKNKMSGRKREEIESALLLMAVDVPEAKRPKYVGEILNSVIVGFKPVTKGG